jgi:hypothetical protein
MLGLGLQLSGGGLVSSNAEVADLSERRVRLSRGLCQQTEVWLPSDRTIRAGAGMKKVGVLTVVTVI